jgi:Flp pilus assembly protein TadB
VSRLIHFAGAVWAVVLIALLVTGQSFGDAVTWAMAALGAASIPAFVASFVVAARLKKSDYRDNA